MRFFTIFTGLVYASVCLAQLDTQALESTLNSTLTEVVGYFDFIESGDLKIDHDYTDVDKGRIKASLTTITTPLDSNANPETGEAETLSVGAQVLTDLTDTDDGRKLFSLNANINIDGNTLVVLKSVADVYGECRQKPINEETPDADHNKNILCFIFNGFRSANTVVELEESIQSAVNYARQVYGDDAATDSLVGDLFSSLVIEAKEEELILSFKVETGKNDITASITDNLTAEVVFTIKENGVSLNATGNTLLEIRQVDELIAQVKDVAAKLAARDSEEHVKYYEDNLYLVFGLIEAFLVVEEDEDDDDEGAF